MFISESVLPQSQKFQKLRPERVLLYTVSLYGSVGLKTFAILFLSLSFCGRCDKFTYIPDQKEDDDCKKQSNCYDHCNLPLVKSSDYEKLSLPVTISSEMAEIYEDFVI